VCQLLKIMLILSLAYPIGRLQSRDNWRDL